MYDQSHRLLSSRSLPGLYQQVPGFSLRSLHDTKGGPAVSADRRNHDPFAPHPRPAAVDPMISVTAKAPTTPARPSIDDMTKPELIVYAQRLRLATYGTKADLVDRIRKVTNR